MKWDSEFSIPKPAQRQTSWDQMFAHTEKNEILPFFYFLPPKLEIKEKKRKRKIAFSILNIVVN